VNVQYFSISALQGFHITQSLAMLHRAKTQALFRNVQIFGWAGSDNQEQPIILTTFMQLTG
jgi:hypothetical protein